ncbi:MAG TPA: dihydrodipicolinate synthase family protein [Chthoniobacteraceae bacterium]|nr:dihydrodipicolinate synthase family protein [Chthoniobacteraceae bacterium]
MTPASLLWSATPTPLTEDFRLDLPSVARMVEWHVDLGVDGVMILGTCGEGPWMPDAQREALIRETVDRAAGRLGVAVQTTDNSPARILEQIETAARHGATLATVAQPWFLLCATPARLEAFYLEIFDRSPLPIAFYDRGRHASIAVPEELLPTLYAHPRVVMAKDSSSDPGRRQAALDARAARRKTGQPLALLNGDEFACVDYFRAGYDGMMLGGAIVNARYVRAMAAALRDGREEEARAIESAMSELLYTVYGGREIRCWLAGLKETLVRLGIFTTHQNYLGYALDEPCRAALDQLFEIGREWLTPAPATALS